MSSDPHVPQGSSLSLLSTGPAATEALGRILGESCVGGEVLLLEGDLGAGKTCLVRGLAAGLGVGDDLPVTSPTFVLHAEYPGRIVLNHVDAYRLEGCDHAAGLGFEEFLGSSWSVTAVEWPRMIQAILPPHYGLHIAISLQSATERRFRLTPFDESHTRVLQPMRETDGLPRGLCLA